MCDIHYETAHRIHTDHGNGKAFHAASDDNLRQRSRSSKERKRMQPVVKNSCNPKKIYQFGIDVSMKS